jgi:hypothetical protein
MKGTALAPSQHIRSTLGKSRAFRAVVVLLGATLALSACGTQPGAAAIVDGTTISDKDVQTVSLELKKAVQGQQQFTPSAILVNLILEPYVLAEATRIGKNVSDAQARKAIAKLANPSRATLDFVRMQLEIPSLSQAGQQSILARLGKAKITVNPRYGTFDAKKGLAPTSPNWIKVGTSPGAK